MTTDRTDNPPGRVSRPDRTDAQPQAHERQQAGRYRNADELDPRNDRGQGSERTQSQGLGNDDDRG